MKLRAPQRTTDDKGYSLISLMVMVSALVFTTSTAFIGPRKYFSVKVADDFCEGGWFSSFWFDFY